MYPPDAVCIEEGCTHAATAERPLGVIGYGLAEDANVVVELVCQHHAWCAA